MTQSPQFSIRDQNDNTYGPASTELLRQWVREGRIVPGMSIAAEGTTAWIDAAHHPAIADLFVLPNPRVPSDSIELAPQSSQPILPAQPAGPIDLGYGSPPARTQPLSIVSLATGVLSFCCCAACCVPMLGMIVAPIGSTLFAMMALVTGFLALRAIRAQPDTYGGKPFAVTGMILGALNLLTSLGLLTAFVLFSLTHR